MKRFLSVILVLLLLVPYFSYAEQNKEEELLCIRHVLEVEGEAHQVEQHIDLDKNVLAEELINPMVFSELDVDLDQIGLKALELDGLELGLEHNLVEGKLLVIKYESKEDGDSDKELVLIAPGDSPELDDGVTNKGLKPESEDESHQEVPLEVMEIPSWTRARYTMNPLGVSFRSSPNSVNVDVHHIDHSGSWAFYHVWDKTLDPITGVTSTFAYFVLEDGGYAFCLNPGRLAPSGSLPVGALSNSDFRRFAEKLATLALSSGGISGYSFEENYVFSQVYLWQEIPFNDGRPNRFQVEFRYQHSPYEKNLETYERFNSWKAAIDGLMAGLDQMSFNGESIELEVGKEIKLTDKNKQLSHYNIKNNTSGLTIKAEGSDLIIKADRPLEAKVEFWQAKTDYPLPEMSYILHGPDDSYQDLGVFRDPYVNAINIRAVESSSRVEVIKKNQLNEAIEGASFELAADEGFKNVLEEIITDKQGQARSKEYNVDQYKKLFVREKSVPHPYIKSDEVRQIDLEPGKTHSFSFINSFKPARVKVVKKDQEGRPVEGAVFELSSSQDFKTILAEAKSSKEGELVFSDLDIIKNKTVYLREKDVPEPYTIDGTIHILELEAGKELVKELINKSKEVELTKTDIVTGLPVAGAIIELTDEKGESKEYKTSSSGQVIIKGISSGSYRFREILAPRGYILNEESFTFTVDQAGKVEGVTDFTNEPTRLKVLKKDEEGKGLEGAGFYIFFESGEKLRASQVDKGYYFADFEGEEEVFFTDSSGRFFIDYLPQGTYLIKEFSAPKGYILEGEAQTIIVDENGGIDKDLLFTNKPTRVVLNKTDLVTGQPVAGAKIIVMGKDYKAEYLTDDEGKVEIFGLEPGNYTFKEELAPLGYLLNDDSFEFTLYADGRVEGFTDFTNEPTRLKIIKKDRQSSGTLEGASFEIFSLEANQQMLVSFDEETGRYLASSQGQELMHTDEKGEIILDYLPLGKYLLVEKIPPSGYILENLEARSYEIEIGETSGIEVEGLEIYNDITRVILKKIDNLTMQALSGAKIQIEGADYKEAFTSDEKGEIVVEGLVPGSYSYKEIEAPKGYTLNRDELSFILTEDGLVNGIIELKNIPTKLLVKKTGDGKKPLEGVVFQIIDDKDRPIKANFDEARGIYVASDKGKLNSFKTDEKGEFTLLYLAKGSYTIKEILVPTGYIAMEDLKFSLEDEPIELKLVNEKELPKTGQAGASYLLLLGLALLVLAKKLVFKF